MGRLDGKRAFLTAAGQGIGRATAEAFARADPYVASALVSEWSVREWTTVAGKGAAMRLA